MYKYFHILLVCFACLTLSAAEFKEDGTFSGKSGSIRLNPNSRRIIFTANDGFQFEFFVEYRLPKGGASAFYKTFKQKDSRKEIDTKKQTASIKGFWSQHEEKPLPPMMPSFISWISFF